MSKSKTARTKLAKAEVKKAEAKAKRAARAQAREEKEAETKALATTKATEIDKLLAQLKSVVDNACERFATDMHDAAELAFRLQDEFGLTQFKIGAAIGRSQQWVSIVLIWRLKGYPDTAFGPQAKQARAKLLPVTGKVAPDPNLGMPPGPKLALLPDNTIVRATGNDVDTESSAETRKAAASETGRHPQAIPGKQHNCDPLKANGKALLGGVTAPELPTAGVGLLALLTAYIEKQERFTGRSGSNPPSAAAKETIIAVISDNWSYLNCEDRAEVSAFLLKQKGVKCR
jgi:hypothetical protein